jgi:hypothetical protein
VYIVVIIVGPLLVVGGGWWAWFALGLRVIVTVNKTIVLSVITMITTISREITQAGKRAFWWFGGV